MLLEKTGTCVQARTKVRSPRVAAARRRRAWLRTASNDYSVFTANSSGSASIESASSASSGWYDYLVGDPWRKLATRFGWLRSM
ncbi:hypothetical protein FJT64_018697 [Amphibalanus amphitrite]|uniref:Uncharacterized protein n=1 Tax=Amphibalanus amphitrite TaxID=1232801 RepID=A0A6A4X2D5_AMPAM|nr:hypothetical protein FJT64_018697 [Amphibalanus amphitrite]